MLLLRGTNFCFFLLECRFQHAYAFFFVEYFLCDSLPLVVQFDQRLVATGSEIYRLVNFDLLHSQLHLLLYQLALLSLHELDLELFVRLAVFRCLHGLAEALLNVPFSLNQLVYFSEVLITMVHLAPTLVGASDTCLVWADHDSARRWA